MQTSKLISVCSQLLNEDELTIDKELLKKIVEKGVVTKIYDQNNTPFIKIFATKKIYLTSVLPILSDFGFTIIDEVSYFLEQDSQTIYVNRFNLELDSIDKIELSKLNIERVVSDSLNSKTFSRCKLFSLVYEENLSIRKILLLRALIDYLDQAVITLNHGNILHTITTYSNISKLFVFYFHAKFDPKTTKREKTVKDFEGEIEEAIKTVPNIMDDKILKLMYALLQNMTRTNYFFDRESVAFKIDMKSFSENLKGIQPHIEAFVYHPEFSGLHLRMSKISRGGLRWSERHEDYRQEIKSLMITQEGKNSIIIPDGAKGGFVINKDSSEITPEYFHTIYSSFINNVLDLIDNLVDGKIVRDERIVHYDGDDSYFVVAADKGTSHMSDVANSISIERGYWLGDAFASGGGNGFGHKELGITARGSLVSTERFFLEEGIDIKKSSISVVGIGSMKGDVFGNGLLYSEHFKLLGAIAHKEIFLDPNPDPKISFDERKRLFESSGGWINYNKELISKGGGVFLRSEKSIELSSEVKKMLGTAKKALSGEELAKKLLMMRVDLLFNGGVGTYVKSVDESNLDLGDKQNEAVRLDAHELNARVVSEGGNLGFTQRARIEYAQAGGKINIDGIDNAAGVDTSDHEVNLKILLNIIRSKGLLCKEDADKTLQGLTDQVVNLVLWSNYHQALAISKDSYLSTKYQNDFITTIEVLENSELGFNRRDFYIPKNENINEILAPDGSIVRPVLCSLLSYSKIFIKTLLLKSSLIDETFATQFLYKYFPKSFVSAYEHDIVNHPLHREIIATVIADMVVNMQGVTFIADFKRLSNDKFLLKIKSYLITNLLFGANDIRYEIFRHDYSMDIELQYKLLHEIEHSLNFSTRWMVKYLDKHQVDINHILDYKDRLFDLLAKNNIRKREILKDNESFNLFFSSIDYLRFAVAAIMIKETSRHTFENVSTLFYLVLKEFKVLEMITSLDTIKTTSANEKILRHQVLQFLEFIVVHYTENVLSFQRINETPDQAFASYLENEKETFTSVKEKIDSFTKTESKNINEVAITVNQIMASII